MSLDSNQFYAKTRDILLAILLYRQCFDAKFFKGNRASKCLLYALTFSDGDFNWTIAQDILSP